MSVRPNPALLHDLEERTKLKSRPVIAHDLGAGELCTKCGPKCPGFQLHFWRKCCTNCRCGKADHNVHLHAKDDTGFFFVGKITDRPLRSNKEVMEFCYGNVDEEGDDDTNAEKKVTFDWIPLNIPENLAKKYLKELPESKVPIAGSKGAFDRQKMLEKQFPVHDIEPQRCHNLPDQELKVMEEYVGHVKRDVAGLGTIHELDELPPPPPELLEDLQTEETCIPETLPSQTEYVHSDNVCEHCKVALNYGDVVIRADRAGPEKVWHPRCFKCSDCKELLVDLLYYYKSGKVYCARDYAVAADIPRCAACDELIFAAEYTGAEGKVWHLRHFCCYECDKPLAGHKYLLPEPDGNTWSEERSGQPHCLYCFQQEFGKMCQTCGQYIAPEDKRLTLAIPGNQDGQKVLHHWHSSSDCFHCKVCGKSLINEKLTVKFGAVLCSSKCVSELVNQLSVS